MPRDPIFVVGHHGMLGRDVTRWLREQGHKVVTTEARFGALDNDPLIAQVQASACSVVVNCAAGLPGRTSAHSQWLVNGLLPIRLASSLSMDQILIHASTDGVFSGASGPYRAEDPPDAVDTYGWSKRTGELAVHLPGVVVIRTSIIGTSAGLLGWLLDQVGDVGGYANHLWSGVTTLEWARCCEDIIRTADRQSRIEHLSSPTVSKFELLEAAVRAFQLAVTVRKVAADVAIDRTLVPTIAANIIDKQLYDLQEWSPR